jgi:hypothetical protein
MSSDSFADLGTSLRAVAKGLIGLFDVNKQPAAGSPADKEADGEPFAGEWSLHPARDLVATLRMECAGRAPITWHWQAQPWLSTGLSPRFTPLPGAPLRPGRLRAT